MGCHNEKLIRFVRARALLKMECIEGRQDLMKRDDADALAGRPLRYCTDSQFESLVDHESNPVFIVSYRWLERHHADPHGFHLQKIKACINKFFRFYREDEGG